MKKGNPFELAELESEETIPVNAGKAREDFVQLFAAHALDRIPPKAFNRADDTHPLTVYEATAINESTRKGIVGRRCQSPFRILASRRDALQLHSAVRSLQIRLNEIWTRMNVDLPKDAVARVNELVACIRRNYDDAAGLNFPLFIADRDPGRAFDDKRNLDVQDVYATADPARVWR